jgi:peptide/nickel transport system ATP-binding protein
VTAAARNGGDNTTGADGRSAELVLEVADLCVDYGIADRALHAVDGVSLSLRRGEVLGIAGESGSGKSTLAYAMNRLLRPPGIITSGDVYYHPKGGGPPVDILGLPEAELRRFRWAEVAMVFQSAMNALNPVMPVRAQITDVLAAHRPEMTRRERNRRMIELLRLVGISPDRAGAYPHELSGGMRQRAMIAIALALEPEIIIMDEPTTALDVVIQRQILTEIMRLRDRLGFSVIFITHDLSLLIELADTIAVMYAGRLVELARSNELYRAPRHPYSYGLLHSFPLLRGDRKQLSSIPGSPPDLRAVPSGCPFHPRCPHAKDLCTQRAPKLGPAPGSPESGQQAACLLYEQDGIGPPPASLGEREQAHVQ